MARFYKGMPVTGRPYVKATSADVMNQNPGQWVRRANHPKPSRLVPNGILMAPHNTGPKAKQTVPMVQFRLACGRSLADVYGTVIHTTPPVQAVSQVDTILELLSVAM